MLIEPSSFIGGKISYSELLLILNLYTQINYYPLRFMRNVAYFCGELRIEHRTQANTRAITTNVKFGLNEHYSTSKSPS